MIENYFLSKFDRKPDISGFTPGRVNLIGEHTDYNGGYVLPTAVPLGLSIAISRRSDRSINIYSGSFDDHTSASMGQPAQDHWSDYAVGAVQFAKNLGFLDGGVDLAVQTTLPFGAGLSSSAAITVGILKLCRDLAGRGMSDTEIAVQARRIENDYIGMPCGIMDQMAVAISRPGQALRLDTDTLDYDLIELPNDYHMAVIHSGVYRRLSEGRYKVRKEECDVVKAVLGREDICRADLSDLDKLKDEEATIQRRTRHCITEHQRTIDAAKSLQYRDMDKFGALMTQSHASMRDDFEITLPAIDALVSDAVKFGAVGARMTGGGFGGCIVACVAKDRLETWKAQLLAQHSEAFYVC